MRAIILALVALSLTACAGDRPLRELDAPGDGPDEFSVTPGLPLELPQTNDLPEPTLGGANRTDTNPIGQALAALGGRELRAGGIPNADAGLVAFVQQGGVTSDIRSTLAAEDDALRNRASRFGMFRRGDRYFAVYARQALDAYAELERFRAAGVATPSAPPQ